ncbi:trehalose 6-phosphate phosphatase [Tersicoccus solisilvae]|uniref:Trehalose 6-phosphate phosphatase n=1 Tax=Tersicoccus solisilvae TaxID=1882339 RepID=A0ABQ1P635_9MICC|nr:trehalose-phosphatase [Tersicoccus solisilvae]GGC90045.1 trehalose 6-phosphate phosphatase [Tersicoccus solisilvae]
MPDDPRLQHALERLAFTPTLLVCMDFDGTLAPLTDRAGDARALPAAGEALTGLSRLAQTRTALVSGRALASLREVARPDEHTLLVASHGAETWLGPDAAPLELDDEQRRLLREVTDAVTRVVDAHPGTELERKPAGVVLHTRRADPAVGDAATAQALRALETIAGVHVMRGKMVVEASVVSASKGDGLAVLRELTGATGILFAGDDVTDETAFAALAPGDVGVKVGDGQTAAAYRVAGPEQVAALLAQMLRLRREALETPPLDREGVGPSMDE